MGNKPKRTAKSHVEWINNMGDIGNPKIDIDRFTIWKIFGDISPAVVISNIQQQRHNSLPSHGPYSRPYLVTLFDQSP